MRAIAAAGQEKLSGFAGLHFTPAQWLHITTLVIGLLDKFNEAGIEDMVRTSARLLSDIPPTTIKLGSVLYHPEAIVLRVDPQGALDPVYSAIRTGARIAMGTGETMETRPWTPHVTLAYSTSVQEAGPIIKALGYRLPACEIIIDRVNLVIQEGAERQWNWRSVAELPLGKPGWQASPSKLNLADGYLQAGVLVARRPTLAAPACGRRMYGNDLEGLRTVTTRGVADTGERLRWSKTVFCQRKVRVPSGRNRQNRT